MRVRQHGGLEDLAWVHLAPLKTLPAPVGHLIGYERRLAPRLSDYLVMQCSFAIPLLSREAKLRETEPDGARLKPVLDEAERGSGRTGVPRAFRFPSRGSEVRIPFPLQANKIRVSSDFAAPKVPKKAGGHPATKFEAVLESILLSRRVSDCSVRIVEGHAHVLCKCAGAPGQRQPATPASLQPL